jgi:hypothetical protein
MRFKAGVRIRGIAPEMAMAALAIDTLWVEKGWDLVVTSGIEGEHGADSLHYVGRALDLRTKAAGITQDEARALAAEIRKRLTEEFDVVVEKDHIHVEFDPKERA